jgi:serine/threonine protein kinase
MLSGTVPFKAGNMNELQKQITKGNPSVISDISDEANDLINRILEVDPKKRINIEQILEHPWLKLNDINNGKFKAKSK